MTKLVALLASFFGSTAPKGQHSFNDLLKALALALAPLVPLALAAVSPVLAESLPTLGLPAAVVSGLLFVLKLAQSRYAGPAK